ncbi:MAG: nucleoside permease [Fimbriimonadales bacterium]|nr:MAG: nucleoside permease [Fimbriimonadales bacterium]
MRRRENAFVIAFRVLFERPSLAVMMFLQYAIWGTWSVSLSAYLEQELGFTGQGLAFIYNALPLMSLIVPFTAGQVADRFMPAQRALALFHLLGGGLLIALAFQRELMPMTVLMLGYAFFYAPTLALSNSVAFRNLKDPEVEFGPIRVWGTIGWIVANWGVTFVRANFNSLQWGFIDLFALAGGVSILAALACLALPHTPPAKEATDPLAFTKAFSLLRDPNYRVFFIIALIVATELPLYYVLTAPFLQSAGSGVGITAENLPSWMTIAQIAEIFTIAFMLPAVLPIWGVRKTMLLGIFAWPARYAVFALAWAFHQTAPWTVWLAVASLALHGFCYVFFFVVAFIYTDMIAPRDVRSSAQALINVAVLGIGMLIGGFFAGWLKDYFTEDGVTNYTHVFLVPTVITVMAGLAFAVLFREKPTGEVATQAN